ncbi:MAG: GGDEF domain-containing protein, partial [Burkholderiaceae bacterium]|nr:GGDEF domain-containing protein [Burkholderiaceae bacterium]
RLPNRRLLDERLALALASSRRTGLHGALMLLDLDNFKPLNDTYGHAAGDLLLIEVARRLSASIREVDTAARLGGDEFVVVIGDLEADAEVALEHAQAVAEKIRATLAQPYLLTVAEHQDTPAIMIEHHGSCSMGLTLFTGQDTQRQTELLKQADDAMYRAKQAGRNTVHL